MSSIRGLTVAVTVGDTDTAVAFYTNILGKKPDFAVHQDLHEWEISPGAWLQVFSGHSSPNAAGNVGGRIRFEVDDIEAEAVRLRGEGIAVEEIESLPRVVAYTNFSDPWGNKSGFYQDLAGPEGPIEVGGKVGDESLFVKGVATGSDAR